VPKPAFDSRGAPRSIHSLSVTAVAVLSLCGSTTILAKEYLRQESRSRPEQPAYQSLRPRDPCEAHLLQRYQAIGDLRLPRPLRLGEAARFDSCSAPPPSTGDAGWMQRVFWAQRLASEPSRQADYQRLLEGVWYGYAEDVPAFFSK